MRTIRFILAGTLLVLTLLTLYPAAGQEPPQPQITIQQLDANPVLPLGPTGAWDGISIRFPYVLYYAEQYHMFYTAFTQISEPQAIGYAVSDDGITWTRDENNPIFAGSGTGFDRFGVNRAVVLVEDDGTWVMYYNGNSAAGTPPFGKEIGRATAPAPTGPWTRSETSVLAVGPRGDWDSIFIFPDSVLKTAEGYVMYYSGNGSGQGMTGRATSPDGITWTKYDDPATTGAPFAASDPVLLPGDAASWNPGFSWGGAVQQTDNGWEMFFTGGPSPRSEYWLGYAFSADGIHWTPYAANPVVQPENRSTLFPSFVIVDGVYQVYYGLSPIGAAKTEAGLAEGTITFK